MPLSDDQKAMLRALSQGKQSYDDLAALLGLSVAEVRAKVADAVAQLVAEGEPVPALPAAPESAAPDLPAAPEPPKPAPATSAPATEAEPRAAAPTATPLRRTPPPRPNVSLPGGGGARAAIVAGALVLVAVVVILIVGGGDSDDSGGSAATPSASGTGTPTSNSDSPDVTQAVLKATDGSDAEGVASFGRVKNKLALQIEASGLEASGEGESYTVWLAQSPQKMLPLATTTVSEGGKIAAQAEVPVEVLGYLADETFTKIVVTRTDNAALQASLKKATAAKEAPEYTGDEVLNGTVTGPIVGAAGREEEDE